jgi:hypothetical protein
MESHISSKKVVELDQADGGGGDGGGGGGAGGGGGGGYTTGCFEPTCKSLVQSNQCGKLLSQKTRDMFARFATEAVVMGKLSGEICPLPGCNEAIIELPNAQKSMIAQCMACKRHFCRCCKGESLTGGCPKMAADAEQQMLAQHASPCPNCKCVGNDDNDEERAHGLVCCKWVVGGECMHTCVSV